MHLHAAGSGSHVGVVGHEVVHHLLGQQMAPCVTRYTFAYVLLKMYQIETYSL